MTEFFFQDVVVTITALAAASVVAWRVFSIVAPSQPSAPCANCPSAAAHGRNRPATQADTTAQPIALIRR
jgi:hypothetical protein